MPADRIDTAWFGDGSGDALAQRAAVGVALMVDGARLELHVETLARRFYSFFNERRFDEAERMVDPEALISYPGASECLIGRAGYAEFVNRWTDAFPDARLSLLAVHVHGETVVSAIRAEGTHEGTLELPGLPPVPATGRHSALAVRETIVVHNGLIASMRLDFDPADLRPAPGL